MNLPDVKFLRDDEGRSIAEGVRIGRDVRLGRNVTIYPSVDIGDGTVVMDGAVIGRLPLPNRTTTRPVLIEFAPLTIGPESIIGCNSVIYTGSTFGRNVLVGDLTSIREGAEVAEGVVIGRGVMVLYNVRIGPFSRIQDQAHLVGNMVIEDNVFIGMSVTTTNDNQVYRSRFGLVTPTLRGPVIRRLATVGAGATIFEGVEIGMGSSVGAGAVVTKDVPAWMVVAGVPARVIKAIPDEWRLSILAQVSAGTVAKPV